MSIWLTNSGNLAIGPGGAPYDCGYCPCDPCAAYYATTLTLTYAGWVDAGDPDFVEINNPNGAYNVNWDGVSWDYGSDILLGTYLGVDVYWRPAAYCAGGSPIKFNRYGPGGEPGWGYNFPDITLNGAAETGVGSSLYYNAGTLAISG